MCTWHYIKLPTPLRRRCSFMMGTWSCVRMWLRSGRQLVGVAVFIKALLGAVIVILTEPGTVEAVTMFGIVRNTWRPFAKWSCHVNEVHVYKPSELVNPPTFVSSLSFVRCVIPLFYLTQGARSDETKWQICFLVHIWWLMKAATKKNWITFFYLMNLVNFFLFCRLTFTFNRNG